MTYSSPTYSLLSSRPTGPNQQEHIVDAHAHYIDNVAKQSNIRPSIRGYCGHADARVCTLEILPMCTFVSLSTGGVGGEIRCVSAACLADTGGVEVLLQGVDRNRNQLLVGRRLQRRNILLQPLQNGCSLRQKEARAGSFCCFIPKSCFPVQCPLERRSCLLVHSNIDMHAVVVVLFWPSIETTSPALVRASARPSELGPSLSPLLGPSTSTER